VKAIWNSQIIADSIETVVVENNHYFPASAIKKEFFVSTDTKSVCPWKGEASYYSVVVDGKENKDSAWYYPMPKEAAKEIKDHVAFWRGVEIVE